MNDSVSVTVEWTPKIYRAGSRAFQAVQFRRRKWIVIGVLTASAFGTIFLLGSQIQELMRAPYDHRASYENGVAAGIAIMTAAILACALALAVMNRGLVKELTLDAPFFSRPWTITVSLNGIQNVGPYHATKIEWGTVMAYKDVGWGIVLSLGPGGFIPLPDEGLPDRIDRAELLRRIEAWHAARDF